MQISRQQHWQFLEDELKAETEEYKKKFLSSALSLLKDSGEIFVGQLITFKGGEMIVRFSNNRSLPRKGEFLLCMLLPKELRDYRNWGNRTYRDLYKERYDATDSVCIWHSASDDRNYSIVGFSRVSLSFAQRVSEVPGVVLVFAPQRPPIDYILNLQKLVSKDLTPSSSSILDANYGNITKNVSLIKAHDTTDYVCKQLQLTDSLVLQGPPGTGKTYLIADLCARLCSEGKSVLVTAMTNRALMEIAGKPALSEMLREKRVFKTNITIDEQKENKFIEPVAPIVAMASSLILSTYYITSGFASELSVEQPFDYIIMDEASQALFAMFAASKKMGKKCLWVGDTKQLAPIVSLNKDRIRLGEYDCMVNGFELMAERSKFPTYQLTVTYRFGPRTANYTGLFYENTLVSRATPSSRFYPSLKRVLNNDGGPSLILTDMDAGATASEFAFSMVAYIVKSILDDNPDAEVAVLTCMRNTTRALQRAILQNVGARKNVRVDTVARIQGLTTDITIFFVPNISYIRTLEPHLFNVATSRAKEHTIIIADKDLLSFPTVRPTVRLYLESLSREQMIYVPAKKKENPAQIGDMKFLD